MTASDSAATALMTFADIGKAFGQGASSITVLRDINLSVARGEIVALLGPSGCGKSTILNIIAGLLTPSTGVARYAGKAVEGLNHQVGYMAQSEHLLPWRTVAGNIQAPLEIAGQSRQAMTRRVAELIDMVGLKGFAEAYPSQISGGMKKRTALARLLAYDPETLLMDEPFSALDAHLRLHLQIELRALTRRLDKTLLFVTHDLEEAVTLGDRCVVFSARPGRIIKIIDVPLPPDRDIMRLRYDDAFPKICRELWSLLAPELENSPA